MAKSYSPNIARRVSIAGPVNNPDNMSNGRLSHTLCVVVSASKKIAMPATSRRMATTQAAIFIADLR
jgi:hypothetical protein